VRASKDGIARTHRQLLLPSRLLGVTNPRKYNAVQRRRELCDAALELLANDGARGLSHPKVDRHAGMPAGTTSAYYRTRKALLIGAAQRMSDLDAADLTRMAELTDSDDRRFSGTLGLATMVVMSGQPPWLTRTKARHELVALAGRDPDLARTIGEVAERFEDLQRALITQWQPAGTDLDPALIDDQAFAVSRFITGVMGDFVRNDENTYDVAHLDSMIQAILEGIRDSFQRATRA
jgi:DNA-binding transcriptional regulator YbjK